MPAEDGLSVELRALVVDDNIDAATSLAHLLQLLACKTATAFDGMSGLRVARVFQPGIVFLELDMPGPDGCEVLAEARKLEGPWRAHCSYASPAEANPPTTAVA